MKDNHHEDGPVTVSLETLARHILETPRNELAALRAAFDRQISSIEARLEAGNHQPAIDATVKIITEVIDERIDGAEQRVETTMMQALTANTMLRKALDHAQQQLESAQTAVAAAEADRKACRRSPRGPERKEKAGGGAGQISRPTHRRPGAPEKRPAGNGGARRRAPRAAARLKDVTAAKASAEKQYQQLVVASQKLSDGLSQTLHAKRDQVRAAVAAPPTRSESAEDKAAGKTNRSPPRHRRARHLPFRGSEPGRRSKETLQSPNRHAMPSASRSAGVRR